MNQLREAATLAVAYVQEASRTLANHQTECGTCLLRQPCDDRAHLQRITYHASMVSRSELLAYLPEGHYATYHGANVHLHGDWWIGGTCRQSLHTTYLLQRPRGAVIDGVPLEDVRRAIDPEPTGIRAAVRATTTQVSHLLATCGFVLPIIVDYDEHKRVTVRYDPTVFARIDQEARHARRHGTGKAAEHAAYVVAALESLRDMTRLARTGALVQLDAYAETFRITRERVERQAAKRTPQA
jgi:hypothetical protein